MIVNTMTPQELMKEVRKDYSSIIMRIYQEFERNRRVFIKATLFPVKHIFKYKSAQNNTWNVIQMARFREERKNPGHIIYSIYENKGQGAYYVKRILGTVVVFDFIPHFFKRYRERYLIPKGIEGLSIEKQVENFFLDGGMFGVDNRDPKSGEFICYNKTGIMLGWVDPSIGYFCVKTYVHYSMFFASQTKMMEYFADVRKKLAADPAYFREHKNYFKMGEEDI